MKNMFRIIAFVVVIMFAANGWSISSTSTANWMSQIPGDRKLNQVMIPGTNDSDSAVVTKNAQFSYANQKMLPTWIQVISNILPNSVFRSIAAQWSKTQPFTISQQLNSGIRYFQFHVCYENIPGEDDHFYVCNTMLNDKLSSVINEINYFTLQNPSEYVIINISKVNGVDDIFKETSLISMLNALLFNNDVPNAVTAQVTLAELRKSYRHVILYLDPQYALQKPQLPNLVEFEKDYLWHRASLEAPSTESYDLQTLKQKLDVDVAFRAETSDSSKQFFALNIEKTISPEAVIDGLLSKGKNPESLEAYEQSVNDQLLSWLSDYMQKYQSQALNIIVQDWFTDTSVLVSQAIQYDTKSNIKPVVDANNFSSGTMKEKLNQLKKAYLN